jgi:PAS domain S-box-containing protein
VGIFNESNELIQVKGYIFDDTERKKAEESLKESERKYRLLFDEDLTGDFIATPEGNILECNPAFAEIYGFTSQNKALNFNLSIFNPTDWVNLINRLKIEFKIKNHQSLHKRPDGKEIYVVANVVGVFNDEGELIQVKGYIFDDTERKKAEESLIESERKYRLLFDEDLTGDFIATIDGKILECNPAFAFIYGFDNCKSAIKWNISESNPFDWPFLVTRLKSEHKIQGYQSWQRRSDGLRIHVVANLMGIFNESNELVQVKGYIFDDTERKQTEQELVQSHKQITEILDSIQDGFIAINHYWQLIYVNKRAAKYVNAEPEDLIGQNLWERFPELMRTKIEKIFRKSMEEDQIQYFDAQGLINVDSLYKFTVYPFTDGIVVYWIDITQ